MRPAASQARLGHVADQGRKVESQRRIEQSLKVRQLGKPAHRKASSNGSPETRERARTRSRVSEGNHHERIPARDGPFLDLRPHCQPQPPRDHGSRSSSSSDRPWGITPSRASARFGPSAGLVVAIAIFSGCPSDPHRRVLTGSGARRLRLARRVEEIGWLLFRTRRSRARSLGQPSLDSGSRRRRLGGLIAPIAGPEDRDARKERHDSDVLEVAARESAHGLALQKRPAPRIRGTCLRYGASPWNSRR